MLFPSLGSTHVNVQWILQGERNPGVETHTTCVNWEPVRQCLDQSNWRPWRTSLRFCAWNKSWIWGTSLVAPRLRICLPMQEMQVRSQVGKLRSHMPRGNWAHTPPEKSVGRNENPAQPKWKRAELDRTWRSAPEMPHIETPCVTKEHPSHKMLGGGMGLLT